MKIGISTIIDYDNYGNRLQNYASQQVIKSFGYQPDTLPLIHKSTFKEILKYGVYSILLYFYESSSASNKRRLNLNYSL